MVTSNVIDKRAAERHQNALLLINRLMDLKAVITVDNPDTCRIDIPTEAALALGRVGDSTIFSTQVSNHQKEIALYVWNRRHKFPGKWPPSAGENVYFRLLNLKTKLSISYKDEQRTLQWKLPDETRADMRDNVFDALKYDISTNIKEIIDVYLAHQVYLKPKSETAEATPTPKSIQLSDRAMETLEAFELMLTESPDGVIAREVYRMFPMGATSSAFFKRVQKLRGAGLLVTDSKKGEHLCKYRLPDNVEELKAAVDVMITGYSHGHGSLIPPTVDPGRLITEEEKLAFIKAVEYLSEQGVDGPTRSQIFRVLYPQHESTQLPNAVNRPEYGRLNYIGVHLEREGRISVVMGDSPTGNRKCRRFYPIKKEKPKMDHQQAPPSPPPPPPPSKLEEPDLLNGLPYTPSSELRTHLGNIIEALEILQVNLPPALTLLLDLDRDFERYTKVREKLGDLKKELLGVNL